MLYCQNLVGEKTPTRVGKLLEKAELIEGFADNSVTFVITVSFEWVFSRISGQAAMAAFFVKPGKI